jgi:predicted NUDIX family phosphoesterase
MVKEVMVVEREKLFDIGDFQGFALSSELNYLDKILSNYRYALRDDKLETDSSLKQIIPYVIIYNPSTRNVFGYKRHKKRPGQDFKEMRLHGKFSIGVGGHVDKEEIKIDVLTDATMRELREEVRMHSYSVPKVFGFVNDDSDPVGQVHFGIVALVETLSEVKGVKGDEVTDERFYSIDEIDKIISSGAEMDSWTRVCWSFVKNYLLKE